MGWCGSDGEVRAMIGSFLYSARPRPDDITLWLQGAQGGAVSARILLPTRLISMMSEQGYPPPGPSMSIDSALSYAVFLAIRSHATLVIAGDRAAWNPDWGYLTDLTQFPTTGLVPEGDRARD
jgi:hypothetical protein